METSLIGKALDFGSNEYGFESHVSNINIKCKYVYTFTRLNLTVAKRLHKQKLIFSKKVFRIIKVLFRLGFIHKYLIVFNTNKVPTHVWVTFFFYRNTPFFKTLRIVSTPSKKFYISATSLRVLNKVTKWSVILLSTSIGVISHAEALKRNIGGLIIGIVV